MQIVSSSIRRPRDEIGIAVSQAPEYSVVAARRCARDESLVG